jgi:hypothetical protein
MLVIKRGSQYKIQVGEREFFIDLLLYHRRLNALVAQELIIGEFEPEYIWARCSSTFRSSTIRFVCQRSSRRSASFFASRKTAWSSSMP